MPWHTKSKVKRARELSEAKSRELNVVKSLKGKGNKMSESLDFLEVEGKIVEALKTVFDPGFR